MPVIFLVGNVVWESPRQPSGPTVPWKDLKNSEKPVYFYGYFSKQNRLRSEKGRNSQGRVQERPGASLQVSFPRGTVFSKQCPTMTYLQYRQPGELTSLGVQGFDWRQSQWHDWPPTRLPLVSSPCRSHAAPTTWPEAPTIITLRHRCPAVAQGFQVNKGTLIRQDIPRA